MHKSLKIRYHHSFWRHICNLKKKEIVIDIATDDDLGRVTMPTLEGRDIEYIFNSLGDSNHTQIPNGSGYYSGENHTYISVIPVAGTTQVTIVSHALINVIKTLERIKNGEVPGKHPDFWRPDYGYRVPGSVSCAYGSEPVLRCECNSSKLEEPDWWGPAM